MTALLRLPLPRRAADLLGPAVLAAVLVGMLTGSLARCGADAPVRALLAPRPIPLPAPASRAIPARYRIPA